MIYSDDYSFTHMMSFNNTYYVGFIVKSMFSLFNKINMALTYKLINFRLQQLILFEKNVSKLFIMLCHIRYLKKSIVSSCCLMIV